MSPLAQVETAKEYEDLVDEFCAVAKARSAWLAARPAGQ